MRTTSPVLRLLLLLLLVSPALAAQKRPADLRTKYNFNPGWQVLVGDAAGAEAPGFNDTKWRRVTLPWAWNEDEAFKKDIKDLSTGVAWYRKHFKLPKADAGKKVFLEFEGVRQGGEFYMNGQFVGRHENGAMAVGFDVTKYLKTAGQENVVAVRTDNDWKYHEKASNSGYQWSDKNFNANYGGIPKNVYLHVTEPLYQTLPLYAGLATTGVYVYAQEFDIPGRAATITTESQVRNEGPAPRTFSYEATITDAEGKVVQTLAGEQATLAPGETKVVRARGRAEKLNFWSWGYGYLYDVATTLKVDGKPTDVVHTRTGFRKTAFRDGMIYLNDRVLMVHGYAQRTSNEWPAVGLSVPPWLSDFSNGLMVESGGNLVRWMHITPWKQDVESCDRVGLLQAMPAGDAEKDVTGRRWEQRTELMRDAIIYNRNNPSVVFYESGNESISAEHMGEMKAIRDQYDPNGGRAIGSREMLDIAEAEYGGEMLYINKSARHPLWAMEYSRDEGLRKYWDEFSPPYHQDGAGPLYKNANASEYNRNQDTHARQNVMRWYDYWRERPGTGKRVNSGGVNIVFSDTNTHYRGAENYRRSGEVDAVRIAKDGFYAHQVMWDGWVEPEKARTHIIGHWNYKDGVTKDVTVVSSGEKVELLLNGKSLGFGEPSYRFLYTFKNVAWQPGTLTAISYDAKGQKVSQAEHQTAGAPVALKLTPILSPVGLKADGADLALVQVEVVDAQGRRCPTDLRPINFSLSGPAEWRGGIAQGPGNYIMSKSLPVEGGVNRILLRSTTKAGTIKLQAAAEGLPTISVSLKSKPVEVKNGLAKALPAEGVPGRLTRGPTPTSPSFTPSRTALAIRRVTASSNQANAVGSYDDNELSEWISDKQQSGAWIQYELERPAALSEVAMKLTGWRRSQYPIRILVDGQEVFRGTTEPSLGYFTAAFSPRAGQTVRIELTGATKSQDAYNITELVTPKKKEAADSELPKGSLGLVEVELYEKAGTSLTP
ncbi:glycoside hydrolase family 2 protein [uncultured Hymenobacter sp.]|uniref:glycoside hydrolase family 2 protein n=1 Tax=uncultured Hymenobacter sp. TaxID=170016 RepID=UPI0035CA2355